MAKQSFAAKSFAAQSFGSGLWVGVGTGTGAFYRLKHSPADVLRWLLVDMGYVSDPASGAAWPGFKGAEPPGGSGADPSLDNCVTFYDAQGTHDGRMGPSGESVDHPGVQVRVRAVSDALGFEKAAELHYAVSQAVYGDVVTVGSTEYLVDCCSRISHPISLRRFGQSAHFIWVVNLTMSLKANN